MRALATTTAMATLLSLLAVSAPCAAEDVPPRRARTSVALLTGYGFQVDSVLSRGVSAYRFGFGTRAGVTLPFGGYVGGLFIMHSGTNVAGTRDGASSYVAIAHDTYLGPEVGFDFSLWRLLLRPYVGSGLLVALGKTAVGSASVSDNHAFFYVAPGGIVAYALGEVLLGLDLRLPLVPAQSSKKWAPAAMVTAGMTFGGTRP